LQKNGWGGASKLPRKGEKWGAHGGPREGAKKNQRNKRREKRKEVNDMNKSGRAQRQGVGGREKTQRTRKKDGRNQISGGKA